MGCGRCGGAGRGCGFNSRHIAAVSNEEVSTVTESTGLPPALQDIPAPTSTSAPTIATTDGSFTKGSTKETILDLGHTGSDGSYPRSPLEIEGMSLVLGATIIIVTGLMMAWLDMLLGMTWTPWRTHLVQEKIGWHWSILETCAMSSHTKRTTGELRIYQWPLVQLWSRKKMGWTYLLIGHEMLYFGNKLNHSLLNQDQIRDHIRHFGGYVQDDFTREDHVFGIKTRDAFIHSTWKVLQSPYIHITQVTMKSKIYPMWRSHQWKSGT